MSRALGSWSAFALVSALLAACSAAPSEAGDATGSADEAMTKVCTSGDCPTPPRPRPLPPRTCGWDPLARFPDRTSTPGERGYSQLDTGFAANQACPAASDELSSVELDLIARGCSLPVFWWALDGNGYGDAVVQLCPYSNDLDDYVYGLGVGGHMLQTNRHEASTQTPHTNWTFTDAFLPPAGEAYDGQNVYYWVVPWECPVCPPTGCMLKLP